MDGIFQREINELYNEKHKESEVNAIKKALITGDLKAANILFKYSSLTKEEYIELKRLFSRV